MRNFISLVLVLFLWESAFSQNDHNHVHPCNTVKKTNELYDKHPEIKVEADRLDMLSESESENTRSGNIIQIPIVYHIIHSFGQENISDEQIYNSVEVLNEQMRLQNPNASLINSNFIDIAADTEIEFVLARKDPQGNCTTGINRIASPLTFQGNQDMKELIQWPRNSYCNIWVCADAADAAGYTFRPSSVHNQPSYDGIVLRHDYTGSIGTSNPTRSTALTHEVGHWLNLAHVWGNTNNANVECGDDGIFDTPETTGWTSCNPNGITCGSLDNVENYMEYSFCSKMFTEGQKTRMRNALNSGVAQRNQLWTNNNLIAAGVINGDVLCEAKIAADYETVCFGDSVYFHDQSYHGIENRLWEFPGGIPATSTEEDPVVYYTEPGLKTVILTVSDGQTSVEQTFDSYIDVLPPEGLQLPFVEGFEDGINEFEQEWDVINFDETFGWELTDNTSANGNSAIWINNRFNDEGQLDEIVSRPIDISDFEEVAVSFQYAYAERNTDNNERLRMYVSRDCGQIWSLRKSIQGNSFPTADNTTNVNWFPNDDEWEQVITTNILETYYVSNLLVKFRFESDGGNNVFLDDINIFDTNVGIVSIADEEYQFKVYPNPSRGFFNISFELENIEDISWQLKDLSGKLIANGTYSNPEMGQNKFQIESSSWSSGIYLFELYTEKGIIAEKIIKE